MMDPLVKYPTIIKRDKSLGVPHPLKDDCYNLIPKPISLSLSLPIDAPQNIWFYVFMFDNAHLTLGRTIK